MPALVDTTIRLLSQEPLAGRIPTARAARLAEMLDGAGFAYLEVSGGGVLRQRRAARRREPVGADPRAQGAHTDAARAGAARALPRRLAAGRRRFRAPLRRDRGRERHRRLPLHDPLNDVSNLREAGEAITAAGREFDAGLVYSRGRPARRGARGAGEASCPSWAPRASCCTTPPGALQPHRATSSSTGLAEASGLPVGLYWQGAAGNALAAALEAARAGADLIACAVYPSRWRCTACLGRGAGIVARRARARRGRGRRRAVARRRSSSTSTSATSR